MAGVADDRSNGCSERQACALAFDFLAEKANKPKDREGEDVVENRQGNNRLPGGEIGEIF